MTSPDHLGCREDRIANSIFCKIKSRPRLVALTESPDRALKKKNSVSGMDSRLKFRVFRGLRFSL